MVAITLVLVGALNWGLVALGFNLVETLLGAGSSLTRVVYLLVGASAVVVAATHKKDCNICGNK